MRYWLLKSEPHTFGLNDLKRKKKAIWDGVRNYQARNFLMEMSQGDLAFFYHSSTEIPGIKGDIVNQNSTCYRANLRLIAVVNNT